MTLAFVRRRLLLFLLPLAASGLAVGYHEIQVRLEQPETRSFLETKAGEILQKEVKIGRLSYVPPASLALEDIQLQGPDPVAPVSIKKLVFGYGILNLIRGDFRIPTVFQVDSPRVYLPSRRSPLPFLGPAYGSSSESFPARLEIRNGEFHYPWGTSGNELVLSKVHLTAKPDAQGHIQLKLKAELEGTGRGKLEMRGFTDPQLRHYELKIHLKGLGFSSESGVPLQEVDGNFFLSDQLIEIQGLTSFLHDWQIKTTGRIEDWQDEPRINVSVERQKGDPPFRGLLGADFKSGILQGSWQWTGHAYPFQGKIKREGSKVIFSELELPKSYTGRGELDASNGNYQFWLEREKRRFRIHSNLSQLGFETEFHLDHVLINHLDWVVLGKARFSPLPKHAGDRGLRFKGEIKTDYLIVEYQPLVNFHGNFELSGEGIYAIDCEWNKVFQLGGAILFRGGKQKQDLVLRIQGLPLANMKSFSGRPLPSNLSGTLEGKLKLRGELANPEVQGYFTIKEGTIEKLEFDRAVIQFQGYPPYLKLFDSTVLNGRNTLKMTGAINLKMPNIFRGVQIRGPDHLVIWKGMSIYWKKGESAIEAEKPLGDRLAMGLEVGQGMPETTDDPEESHAVLGPKFKF